MSEQNFEKLSCAMSADQLLDERPADTPLVMVRSVGGSVGYWGRGHSVRSALRNAQWLERGATVVVFLCNRDTQVSEFDGSVRVNHEAVIYQGKVTADKDVKVTHRLVKEA